MGITEAIIALSLGSLIFSSELAATFHEFVAHLLSERLMATTRTLEAVLR